jgi:hypothetical protein
MALPAPVQRVVEAVQTRVVAPLRDRFTAEVRGELAIERNNMELLRESVTDLERQLDDPGWTQFIAYAQQEFSPAGMVKLRAVCRLYTLKNPLLKRAAALRSAYVWGQGVEITARANGKEHAGEQDVQAIVAAFLDDPGNKRTLTGAEARNQNEHALFTDGELFHALFTSPRTGRVQVRTLPADEVVEVICNPEDNSEPWFYRRRWVQMSYQGDGTQRNDQREELYPCIDYRPPGFGRFRTYANLPIRWDAPVVHTTVNRPMHWHRGVPDAYAGVDWARAYKTFLEDWATLMRSLAKFAWRLTSKGSARSQARRALAGAAPIDPVTGKALDVGATAVTPLDQMLEAIPKTGAVIDSESGRPIAAMAGAAYGMPVTMLLADPGTTGNRATAETLDRPTELDMGQRRELWTSTLQRILTYVITAAVRAPEGPLKGSIVRDTYSDQDVVTLDGDTSTKIDIEWPDLSGADIATIVKSIVEASGTGTMPPELVLRLVLTALGVRDVDELVEAMLDDETGEFQWPKAAPFGPGSQAAGLERAGRDPTGAGPGPMEDPDDPPNPDDAEEEDPSDEEDEDEDG